uniref:Uncharacterized protein n=1 Tax=viral metagenome TaxID=1070528 RepID=A0A6C0BDD2_9ZZZZ
MADRDDDFTVHDNTFTSNTALNIINLFSKFREGDIKNSHDYFFRRTNNLEGGSNMLQNPVEYIINDYLSQIGDKSQMVEYWYRGVWLDVKCHQDLNEFLLASKDIVINPNHGHIMYLSELTDEAGTVLFSKDNKYVSIIYPKIGRTVRFNGKCFHYVPNPFNYMFGDDGSIIPKKPRFVLLFNTWNEYIPDPKEKRLTSKLKSRPTVNDFSEWIKLPLFQTVRLNDSSFKFRVRYMGESMRRFNRKKVGEFYVNPRFKKDGYHQRLIKYEIKPVTNGNDETEKI